MMQFDERYIKNVPDKFFSLAGSLNARTAVHLKVGESWQKKNWCDVSNDVSCFAAGLLRLGVKRGDYVIVFSRTRYEWSVADLAIMSVGAIVVPVYHSFKADRISYILSDTKPSAAIVEDTELLKIFDEAMKKTPHLKNISVVTIEQCGMHSIDSFRKQGFNDKDTELKALRKEIEPVDVATIVYTSGTTGELKGAEITHENVLAEVAGVKDIFKFGPDDIGLLWLPLAHVLGRMMSFYGLLNGCQTAYVEDLTKLPAAYREVRPDFVCGVPRMLEKIHEEIGVYKANVSSLLRHLIDWSINIGKKRLAVVQSGHAPSLPLRIKYVVASLLIFSKVKSRLGGRLRCFVCGGARLSEEVARLFCAAGIPVLEGYGLTETFAAVTVNRYDDMKLGSVGKPIEGVKIKIAADGEVLIKGKVVFKSYINKPAETKATFDSEGWFKTGDLGEFSSDGFLFIKGRKKEILVTAGGKNIAPTMIEALMMNNPYIMHFVVFGEGRKYLTALVTLNRAAVLDYLKKHGADMENSGSLGQNAAVVNLIKRHVDEKNDKLASYETIKRFAVLNNEFSVDTGELTPTLKVRREFIFNKYKDVIESLY